MLDGPTRDIANNLVSPDKLQKPWLELGVGVNHSLNEASSLTGQVSYKQSISNDSIQGGSVNLVYRFKW